MFASETPAAPARSPSGRFVPAGASAAMLAGAVIAVLGLAAPLDRALGDNAFRALRGMPLPPTVPPIVVVAIDESSVAALPEPIVLWHRHLGAVLTAAAGAGARIVGVDVVLPDRSLASISPDLDRALVDGVLRMRLAGGVVLALTVDGAGVPRAVHAPLLAAAGPTGAGYALWRLDSDRVVRRYDERMGAHGETVAMFAGRIARALAANPREGGIQYALGDDVEVLSFGEILRLARIGDDAALAALLRGKVVLIGSTLPFADRVAAPIALGAGAPAGDVPGVLVHAQALRTLLAGRTVRTPPGWVVWTIAAALAAAGWLAGGRPLRAAVGVVAAAALAVAVAHGALDRDIALPTGTFAAAFIAAVVARTAIEAAFAWRERVRLRHAFGGYVSPAVMAEIESGRLAGLASARRFIVVLILDVRDFTTRTEHEPPERVIATINALCEQATAAIHARGGTVDKFMGDGILAFFGAPAPLADPAAAAFDAAVDILARVRRLGERLAGSGEAPLAIGIGLSCGEAVVGHVGAASRHAYTAIGDCVNVASRLESLTKTIGHPVAMTAELASRLAGRSGIVALGRHDIKGHTPVEVVGWKPT